MPTASSQPTPRGREDGASAENGNIDGIVRSRSIYAATRSSLSPSARPSGSRAEPQAGHALGLGLGSKRTPLLERLPSAAQALRYEAILDAFSFISKHVVIKEFDDYAAAGHPIIFASVRPLDSGDLDVGLALPPTEDEMLTACKGEFPSATITSKFLLEKTKPIGGRQMQLIRLASRAVKG